MAKIQVIARKYPLGSAFVVGFAVFLALLGGRRITEPRYEGKGIREWIRDLPYDYGQDSSANLAIEHFGPAAIPYLFEAANRPGNLDWWLARHLPAFLSGLRPDLEHLLAVQSYSLGKLGEWGKREKYSTAFSPNATRPIAAKVVPFLATQLQSSTNQSQHSHLLNQLEKFGAFASNAMPQIMQAWETIALRQPVVGGFPQFRNSAWATAIRLLASFQDPRLIPEFLPFTKPPHPPDVRAAAILALGQTGHPTPEVKAALVSALSTDDYYLQPAALNACALLAMCPPEVMHVLRKPARESTLHKDHYGSSSIEVSKPVLLWLHDPDDQFATAWIKENLTTGNLRRAIQTTELLERAGPRSREFIPDLIKLLDHPAPIIHVPAADALRIDPATAEKEIRQRYNP